MLHVYFLFYLCIKIFKKILIGVKKKKNKIDFLSFMLRKLNKVNLCILSLLWKKQKKSLKEAVVNIPEHTKMERLRKYS